MRIQTFSILAGSAACNARCPFCISRMTPPLGVELAEPEVNWRNFAIACRFAAASGVTTAMITGKGEPMLFPGQITKYLRALRGFGIPLVELQTNGILPAEQPDRYAPFLREWYDLGMTTVALSVVHCDDERNRAVYLPHKERYIDLPALIGTLHGAGLSVRLTVTMLRGFIDSPETIDRMILFAREQGVEQLTVRPVGMAGSSRDGEAHRWTTEHRIPEAAQRRIHDHLESDGRLLMTLIHGGKVYDVGGQNICLTDCLTIAPGSEDLRQVIFFPDGHLRYDWQSGGAILL